MGWTLLLLGAVWAIFRSSWGQIAATLSGVRTVFLPLLAAMGLAWYFFDAASYHLLCRRQGCPLGWGICCRLSFLAIFCDVTTMGALTKPLQLWYGCRHGMKAGRFAGILVIPYLFQKLSIAAMALGVFLLRPHFVERMLGSNTYYVYVGAALSLLICLGLALLCAAPRLHSILLRWTDRLLKADRWKKYRELAHRELGLLAEGSREIFRDRVMSLGLLLITVTKLCVQYLVPAAAMAALGTLPTWTEAGRLMAMTGLLKLLMGVIPTSGGVGSLEVVFSLLFAAAYGTVTSGALLVLFRLATYYLPFLVGATVVGSVFLSYKKEGGGSAEV